MSANPRYIGRVLFFKYLIITFLILVAAAWGFVSLTDMLPEDKRHAHDLLIQRVSRFVAQNSAYLTIHIMIGSFMAYKIFGKVGESIIEKNTEPYWAAFKGFLFLWTGIFIVSMSIELMGRWVQYGVSLSDLILGSLMWLLFGMPVFLMIGAVHGGLTGWFLGREIKAKGLRQKI